MASYSNEARRAKKDLEVTQKLNKKQREKEKELTGEDQVCGCLLSSLADKEAPTLRFQPS